MSLTLLDDGAPQPCPTGRGAHGAAAPLAAALFALPFFLLRAARNGCMLCLRMEWYKTSSGKYQALEWALVHTVVCLFGGLLAAGLWFFVVRVAAGVVVALGLS